MTDQQCPSCHAEQPDGLLCATCTRHLTESLQKILPAPQNRSEGVGRQTLPWEDQAGDWTGLADQLTASLARLGQSGSRNGGRSSEQPMPFDMGASGALTDLHNVLAYWVNNLSMGGAWPDNKPSAMAEWLLDRMHGIRGHERASDIKADICEAVSRAMKTIDARASSAFAGKCKQAGCTGDVYARPGADTGTCRACEAPHDGITLERAAMLVAVAERLASRREILTALPEIYGVEIGAQRFSNWLHRKRITAAGQDSLGADVYRIGDVLDLASGGQRRQTG